MQDEAIACAIVAIEKFAEENANLCEVAEKQARAEARDVLLKGKASCEAKLDASV